MRPRGSPREGAGSPPVWNRLAGVFSTSSLSPISHRPRTNLGAARTPRPQRKRRTVRCAPLGLLFLGLALVAPLPIAGMAVPAGPAAASPAGLDSASPAGPPSPADSASEKGVTALRPSPWGAAGDSARWVKPIVVRATRIPPQEVLDRLPGHTHVVELSPLRDQITTTAEALEAVPGLHVSNYGGLGSYSTVSIRGAGAGQVSIYLDGVPLGHAGLGVQNLADLPFAGLDRLEVYRGFAPNDFPGAGPAGAINLVTRTSRPGGPPMSRSAFVAGAGSYGTTRLGGSFESRSGPWSVLAVADLLSSDGNFDFDDDIGTPLETLDDRVVPRSNNWQRADELLLRFGRTLPAAGELQCVNSLVRREHGVPGIGSYQSEVARGGTVYDVLSASARWPVLAGGRLGVSTQFHHQWRRDTFSDPESEIGLGRQDNRDQTREWGGHLALDARLPLSQQAGLDVEARHERFVPYRRYPAETLGPDQVRRSLVAGLEDRLHLLGRLEVTGGIRLSWTEDAFAGDLRTPYSQRPARSASRRDIEPRLGLLLRLPAGFTARANGGEYHRTPGFLELFGDGGSIAGSSDLVPESGRNRDLGLQYDSAGWGVAIRLAGAVFRNRVDHWITFLPQSQRTFVARNIGSARIEGDEWSWRLAASGSQPRFCLEGSLTRLDARDLGVDISWYAGRVLPGRPARELHQRAELRLGAVLLGYDYEHLGRNYLDRRNREVVARRDLHGLEARAGWRGLGLHAGIRNLTDERAADVAGFPLPGRTIYVTTTYTR